MKSSKGKSEDGSFAVRPLLTESSANMWGILLANVYGLGLVAAFIALAAHVILRTPELLLVAYSWLKVEKMDERPREAKSGQRPLHRPQWETDTVYLVQWPVSPNVRSISPFALKVTDTPHTVEVHEGRSNYHPLVV